MTAEHDSIDISESPELARLAEDVQEAGRACVLRRDGRDVAVVTPVGTQTAPRRAGRVLTESDPLFDLIGIGDSGIPGGISGKKRAALRQLRHT